MAVHLGTHAPCFATSCSSRCSVVSLPPVRALPSFITPAELSLIVPPTGSSDCGKSLTVINPAYSDGRVFVVQVVFHLIEKTDGTGHITEDQVNSQIQILNEDCPANANSQ